MKTNKIPFDPKYMDQIKTQEIIVETRSGYKAAFIGMSKFNRDKYLFEVETTSTSPNNSVVIAYGSDGINPGGNTNFDLFLILPEIKMTKLQLAILEVFRDIITDYKLDISQSTKARVEYAEKIRVAFMEELGIKNEEIKALENILDYIPEGANLDIVEGLLQKLKEYEVK